MKHIDTTNQISYLEFKITDLRDQVQTNQWITSQPWATDGMFRIIGAVEDTCITTCNIDTIKQCAICVEIYRVATSEACRLLDIDIDENVQGYDTYYWYSDFKRRIAIISNIELNTQINVLEQQLTDAINKRNKPTQASLI